MTPIAQVAAIVAAALHIGFFYLESVAFTRSTVWPRFGLSSQDQAEIVRPMAFNQGFYNLFLALGIVAGLALVATGSPSAGTAIVGFACACMIGAGAVLLATDRRFVRAAAMQLLPPLVALLAILIG